MDNRKALSIISECHELYNENLNGQQVVFLYIDNGEKKAIPVMFNKDNFKHLTGVKYSGNALNFFDLLCEKKVSYKKLNIDYHCRQKLQVLKQLMSIDKLSLSIGDYNNSLIHVKADKILGKHNYLLGIEKTTNVYIPKTILNKPSIKEVVGRELPVLAILKITYASNTYELTYINKKRENEANELYNWFVNLKLKNFNIAIRK